MVACIPVSSPLEVWKRHRRQRISEDHTDWFGRRDSRHALTSKSSVASGLDGKVQEGKAAEVEGGQT